jgi:hypothetical protein
LFPDQKSRIGTLRYVLPSTGTRRVPLFSLVELFPSDENVPSDSPTVALTVTETAFELVEADVLELVVVAELLVAITLAVSTEARLALERGGVCTELKAAGGELPPNVAPDSPARAT